MDTKDEVMELDRQFCQDCKTGKEVAWASYFAEDGVMVTSGQRTNIVGKKAIKEAMLSIFSMEDVVFDWEPETCEISSDHTLAVTRGTSKLSYTKEGENLTQYGNYTTVWKKVNGAWKIVWDIGN